MKRYLIALALAGCSPNMPAQQDQAASDGELTAPQPPEEAGGNTTSSGDVPMELTLDELEPGAEVTSPLSFSGSASGLWYFEGDFPVRLVDGTGTVIAESYAASQSDRMTEEQVPFKGEIRFEVTEPTEATLIFQEDDPSGMKVPAEHPVPVVLLPAED